MAIRNWAALLALAVTPVTAQEGPLPLPVEALLTLGERPDLDGVKFEQSLSSILPSTAFERVLPEMPFQDSFLWFFMRTLGGQSSDPGNTLTCSRHGLATRAWFAENRNSSPESVLLDSAVSPLKNDQQPWPEDAVAQLHCELFLGEVDKIVAGLTEAEARAALSMFHTVSEPMEPELQTLVYGPDGYSVKGIGGKSSSTMQIGSAQLTRIANGHVFLFSSFLINAGS
jgi:hypothetical protein